MIFVSDFFFLLALRKLCSLRSFDTGSFLHTECNPHACWTTDNRRTDRLWLTGLGLQGEKKGHTLLDDGDVLLCEDHLISISLQQANNRQQYHIPCRRLAGWRWELSYGSKSISKIRAQVWPPERVELVARLASLTALGALGLAPLALTHSGLCWHC